MAKRKLDEVKDRTQAVKLQITEHTTDSIFLYLNKLDGLYYNKYSFHEQSVLSNLLRKQYKIFHFQD